MISPPPDDWFDPPLSNLDRELRKLTALEKEVEELRAENERLRPALHALVEDVLEYERVNNLSPNPGRQYCWDSVAAAVAVLEQKP